MPLSDADSEELQRLAPDKIRSKLASAGAGRGTTVPGLGDGMMLRGDVEDWLAERDRESAKREADTLFFNKCRCLDGRAGPPIGDNNCSIRQIGRLATANGLRRAAPIHWVRADQWSALGGKADIARTYNRVRK
jgi:hypothetical protein